MHFYSGLAYSRIPAHRHFFRSKIIEASYILLLTWESFKIIGAYRYDMRREDEVSVERPKLHLTYLQSYGKNVCSMRSKICLYGSWY